jgi:hypothetical protein
VQAGTIEEEAGIAYAGFSMGQAEAGLKQNERALQPMGRPRSG